MQVKKLLLVLCIGLLVEAALGQTTEFTYQGSMKNGAVAANGNYDFEFLLYSAPSGGTQIGTTIPRTNIAVVDGIFSVKLDFGTVFPGADRYLEIRVKSSGPGGFTILDPRQRVGSSPHAIKSLSAETAANATNANNATNAAQLGGIAANQYVQTTDPRLNDARPPTAGSANYIQNTAEPQVANFDISGNGFVGGTLSGNIVSAATRYNLGGNTILRVPVFSTYLGINAGAVSTGQSNSFFGTEAGRSNTSGGNNSYFGLQSAFFNTTGSDNSFFGVLSGLSNTTGNSNSFFGRAAGNANLTGSNNSALGSGADVASGNLVFATAIGAGAVATTNNRVQVGRAQLDTVRIGGLIGGSSSVHICIADFTLSTCSSSRRYKEDIQPLAVGVDLVRQFRPVNFKWKDRDERDIGLIAEEVAEVEPLLVSRDQNGEIEGVKYELITALLISAVKEQQTQIESQKAIIEAHQQDIMQLRQQVDALIKLISAGDPKARASQPSPK